MRRREFITLVGGAAAWPLAAWAQRGEQQKRVGVLNGSDDAVFEPRYVLFRDALAQLGWTEPRNLRIDYRTTDGDRRKLMEAYARELVSLAPDVIFAEPGPAAEALQRLTSAIPIVFNTATDPVAAGYVQSYAHPGGNMTGFTVFEVSMNSKWLQLLKDVAPNMTRVAVLHFGGNARARRDLETIDAVALSFGVTSVNALARDDAADIATVIDAFAHEPNGGLIVPPSIVFNKHRELIAMLADRHKLPAIYNNRGFVDAGGLMSYGGADRLENYRRVAGYVDRILRGAKPDDLPVQAPTRYELVVNLKAAKAIGLTLPESLLSRADEVIE